uniref:Peptidase S1 domain-containing protein n=1 Tax=Anopheles dirus TaxID=7168 RepID=A0A182NS12_9DIPT
MSVIILNVLIVVGCFETEAIQIGCGGSDQRCVPIKSCPSEYDRLTSIIGKSKRMQEYNHVKCTPERQIGNQKYVRCRKRDIDIQCDFNGQKGVYVPRENCPNMQNSLTKQQLSDWSRQLGYVHNGKEYLCCTYEKCLKLPTVCDPERSVPQRPPAFPSCTNNGVDGSLVPDTMCVTQEQSNQSSGKHVCCVPPKPDRLMSRRRASRLANMECGMFDNGPLIQNGQEADRGEFPWMAYLVYKQRGKRCAGTLIHPSYVLTAKHCMKPNEMPTHVMLGVHDASDTPPCSRTTRESYCSQVQKISVASTPSHNKFDIGLLRLASKATLDPNSVFPICLPLYASLRMQMPESVIITGWGKTENGTVSNVLLKATTTVVIRGTACPDDHLICAGGKNDNNHCPGDSGGPYQKISSFGDYKRYVQYGVIAYGSWYCSQPDQYSRGMLVSYFMDWILDKMHELD